MHRRVWRPFIGKIGTQMPRPIVQNGIRSFSVKPPRLASNPRKVRWADLKEGLQPTREFNFEPQAVPYGDKIKHFWPETLSRKPVAADLFTKREDVRKALFSALNNTPIPFSDPHSDRKNDRVILTPYFTWDNQKREQKACPFYRTRINDVDTWFVGFYPQGVHKMSNEVLMDKLLIRELKDENGQALDRVSFSTAPEHHAIFFMANGPEHTDVAYWTGIPLGKLGTRRGIITDHSMYTSAYGSGDELFQDSSFTSQNEVTDHIRHNEIIQKVWKNLTSYHSPNDGWSSYYGKDKSRR